MQYYQYALDLVTDVFDFDCDDDMREQIEKSARHLYGLVHARYIVTTRGLAKMVCHVHYEKCRTRLTQGLAAREVQEVRLRQMPSRHVRITTTAPDGPVRRPQHLTRQALLRALRGPLQPKVLTTRCHRRCLFRYLLSQYPFPSIPGDATAKVTTTVRAPCFRLQSTRSSSIIALAVRTTGPHEG